MTAKKTTVITPRKPTKMEATIDRLTEILAALRELELHPVLDAKMRAQQAALKKEMRELVTKA